LSLKVPDAGELVFLENLAVALLNGARVLLYQNNYTPVDGSVLGDFTEADFDGYTANGQVLGSHSTPAIVSGRATTTWTPKIWTHDGGATANLIYGYYVVDGSLTELLFAERDPAGPRSLGVLGDAINVFVTFTNKTEF